MARTDRDDSPLDAPVGPESAVNGDAGPSVVAEQLVPPEILAQTLGQYARGQWLRIKSGDSGMLPPILALIAIVIVFQVVSPHHVFLSAGNLVNLFQQSAVFMVLAIAEIFTLLLGEMDLSAGSVMAIGGVIAVQLVQPVTVNWPWWAAVVIAIVACALAGLANGVLITVFRLPAFIVTLATQLIFFGVLLITLLYGPFSGYPSLNGRGANLHALYEFMWGRIHPLPSWIAMAVIVALMGGFMFFEDTRRRRSGLVAPPVSLTLIKIAFMAGAGIAVVAICNVNRASVGTLSGVPFCIPIVLGVLGLWTFVLRRTRYGRYVYAIGGNREAARRAGVKVNLIRTLAFVICSATAGVAGLLYASYQGGMSNNVNVGQEVLYAIAAAVIGGTSLFGGRGKVVQGVLGGLVIGAIYNGMYLENIQVQWQYIVTGCVLIFAVLVDALSRRASEGSGFNLARLIFRR